jgi:hypothetical protein
METNTIKVVRINNTSFDIRDGEGNFICLVERRSSEELKGRNDYYAQKIRVRWIENGKSKSKCYQGSYRGAFRAKIGELIQRHSLDEFMLGWDTYSSW